MDYLHLWRVKEVVPQKRIVYEWRYGGVPGNSTVTWELSETPEGTKLKLTHEGIKIRNGEQIKDPAVRALIEEAVARPLIQPLIKLARQEKTARPRRS